MHPESCLDGLASTEQISDVKFLIRCAFHGLQIYLQTSVFIMYDCLPRPVAFAVQICGALAGVGLSKIPVVNSVLELIGEWNGVCNVFRAYNMYTM